MRSRIIPAVLISALVIYVLGVYTGWYVTNTQLGSTEQKIQGIEAKLDNIREWTKTGNQQMCPVLETQFENQMEELSLFWNTLPYKLESADIPEETLRSYSEIEIEAYFVGKSLETKCDKKLNIVLYFMQRNSNKSVKAGSMLDEAGEGAMVLTLPVDVDSPSVEALSSSLNLTQFPAVKTCNQLLVWPFTEQELSDAIAECKE